MMFEKGKESEIKIVCEREDTQWGDTG